MWGRKLSSFDFMFDTDTFPTKARGETFKI